MNNEQNNNQVKLLIILLDLDNPMGIPPSATHTSQISNINEVRSIMIEGEGFEDIVNDMPKSWKFRLMNGHRMVNGKHEVFHHGYCQFDTFHSNKVTGDKNEAAMKRRINVINRLASMGL
jgi:hypothetical protein